MEDGEDIKPKKCPVGAIQDKCLRDTQKTHKEKEKRNQEIISSLSPYRPTNETEIHT